LFRIAFQLLMELVGYVQQGIHFLEVMIMRHAPAIAGCCGGRTALADIVISVRRASVPPRSLAGPNH
jgi:hypothetical protein